MTELFLALAVFVCTYFGVAAFYRWSIEKELFDIPNQRSSHDAPTPRGGGLVIVVVSLAAYAALFALGMVSFSWGYFIGAAMIAAISWLDDLRSVGFLIRFAVHTAAALLLIQDLGFWREIYIPVFNAQLAVGEFGLAIAFGWVVWMINAYNFMDGIDGIAGLQAVAAGGAWAVLAYIFGITDVYYYAIVVAVSSAGFLIHNWQPASIFMGDVGSAFLGFTFAALPLLASKQDPGGAVNFPVVGVFFVWMFVFDTVVTFLRRLVTGQRVWTAHRQHLYQLMIIKGLEHASVTAIYGISAILISAAVIIASVYRGILDTLLVFVVLALTATIAVLASATKSLTTGSNSDRFTESTKIGQVGE